MKKIIPADVPKSVKQEFIKNINRLTHDKQAVFLFAGDQKIEHLNADFSQEGLAQEINNPQHLFEIASTGASSAFATQLGLITRYGNEYPSINYVAKLNSKTSLLPHSDNDPCSLQLWSVDDVVATRQASGLNICAVGYTLYLGSDHESEMLTEAAQIVTDAHQNGLPAILWIYPRSRSITDDQEPGLIAGAAGVGNALGADIVKLKMPKSADTYRDLKIVTQAAGNTGVIISGGSKKEIQELLTDIYEQIHQGETSGVAIGRNIFQRPLKEALALTHAIHDLVYEKASAQDAYKRYQQETKDGNES